MNGIDFDFPLYIQHRRGQVEQRVRDGSAYAYSGERKVRRTLDSAKPVVIALEGTTRLWKNVAKTELLGTALRATSQQFPRLFAATREASAALRMEAPPVYVAPSSSPVRAQTLGTNDDAYIVVNAEMIEQLRDSELVTLIGHELGHLQNNQVLYNTALYYLTEAAAMFVRWAVQPAIVTLQAWSRRAEITCDRAALLCTRNLDVTMAALIKISLGLERDVQIDVDEYIASLPETKRGVGRYAELFRTQPYLPKRIQALRRFADSALYKSALGESTEGAPSTATVDAEVAEILSVF
ncbi:M48 family metallopeptidase [Haliangium ochraceum]|uniref:Peptidase M48 Ste24p n=1 Tax=Haliangium ochraceum (strain DSM 14365 / JCM 11303 / SMP-2) TaxID=502025 RepID=D0LVM3_HALO1|nr:M48 family metallopeptidase [Haliangium ochraceum]ACY19341.1 peptidase M48 Ste24p [Haliangium ochraceum DSM 14365]